MTESAATYLAAIWAFSGVIFGAVLGSVATIFVAQRQLRSQNVIAERTKWRHKIREIARDIGDNPIRNTAWIDLAVNTNPYDSKDAALVDEVEKLVGRHASSDECKKIVKSIAIILKHDWERAKIESSWWSSSASKRAKRKLSTMRIKLFPNVG